MTEGWTENDNGNWIWFDDGAIRATVYAIPGGEWGGVWNGAPDGSPRRLKAKYDYAEEAQSAIEAADAEGPTSQLWHPPDHQWIESKKGGYYRRVNGSVVSVKRAKSNSWYAVTNGALLGDNGMPTWFRSAEEACKAVDAFAAGHSAYSWSGARI